MAEAMTDTLTEAALFEILSLECRVDSYGNVSYHNSDGELHRVYGPAVEHPGGFRTWWQNGSLHRLDGPALEYSDGFRSWWQNGLRHRLDGPAVEHPDGVQMWYINDKKLTAAEWQQQVASMGNVMEAV